MELKEFIKSTISQIGDAVKELNEEDRGIIVNPNTSYSKDFINYKDQAFVKTTIEFHIDLAIDEKNLKNGQVGVLANIIGIGGKYESHKQSQSSTSIDFRLDVLLPQG